MSQKLWLCSRFFAIPKKDFPFSATALRLWQSTLRDAPDWQDSQTEQHKVPYVYEIMAEAEFLVDPHRMPLKRFLFVTNLISMKSHAPFIQNIVKLPPCEVDRWHRMFQNCTTFKFFNGSANFWWSFAADYEFAIIF